MAILQEGKHQPEISLFSVALAPEGSRPLQNAILKASDFFLRKGYFEELLELISSSDLRGDGVGGPAIDFLLSSAILSKGGTRSELRETLQTIYNQLEIPELKFGHVVHKKAWILLARIKDHHQLTRLVLRKLNEWNAKTCIDLIELCLSRPIKNIVLRKDLERKRKEISLHQKFDLAGRLAELHNLPSHFIRPIKESHLKHLLANSPEEHMKAYRILEGLQDQDMSLVICESLCRKTFTSVKRCL
ncbi:Zinc finger FYVE domain-containing protein 26 [Desmophyllum pertusum]|uniref:Zinc finger FYVE domain-containing protein 26 n=1 Tax=Desmophyllum pertusum TaxID=174260 RepID=A0A9X0CQZ3_9CNID|nr:Zinc finger FYVE domain-containing protein 26 [Desmophyllum pertusum]